MGITNDRPWPVLTNADPKTSLTGSPQTKSAEYEKPLNSSCIACDSTVIQISNDSYPTYAGDDILPDCTGVKTGVTLVNSESKLLVSARLLTVGVKGAGTRL